jgi:hypothetical protein
VSFQFRSRVIVTGQLVFRNGAKVEMEQKSDDTPDLSVIRDITGLWYISGSSMKRLLRARAREVVLGRIGESHACDPYRKGGECIRTSDAGGDGIHLKEMLAQHRWSDEHLKTAIEYFSCVVCSLFGSELMDSKIVVEDLRPAVYAQSRLKGKEQTESLEGKNFVFRAVLTDCEAWQRGLFLAALSRLQTRLLRVACGGMQQQAIATLEVTNLRALESAREYLETLDGRRDRDGHDINMMDLQAWHSALIARFREFEKADERQLAATSA